MAGITSAQQYAATVCGGVLIITSWVVAFVLEALTTLVLLPFTSRVTRQKICGLIFRACSGIFVVYLNPFWKLRLVNKFPSRKPRRTIFMCNHLSNSDPFFLCTSIFPTETKWISKSVLFKVPFGGWCMTLAGDVPVHFTKDKGGWGTKKGSVGRLMEDCARLLQLDQAIFVFPEGVRADDPTGPLQEFKDGFFQLALQENADIIPLAISGSSQAWPKTDNLMGPATAFVSFGTPLRACDYSLAELKEAVRQQITTLRDAHPDVAAGKMAKAARD